MSGRPVDERRPAIRERTADIPGRLVTEGDVIRYFSGFLNDDGEDRENGQDTAKEIPEPLQHFE